MWPVSTSVGPGRPESTTPDDVRAVRQRVLEVDLVEAHPFIRAKKRVCELTFRALHARNPNDLLRESDGLVRDRRGR